MSSAAEPHMKPTYIEWDDCDAAGKALVSPEGTKPFAYSCSRNIAGPGKH